MDARSSGLLLLVGPEPFAPFFGRPGLSKGRSRATASVSQAFDVLAAETVWLVVVEEGVSGWDGPAAADQLQRGSKVPLLVAPKASAATLLLLLEELLLRRPRDHEETARQRAMLESIVRSSSEAIFVKDLKGTYVFMTEAGARVFGRTPQEFLGHSDLQIMGPETASELLRIDQTIMATGEPYVREQTFSLGDQPRIFLTHKAAWKDDHGRTLGVIGIASDITVRKQNEQRIQSLLSEKELVLREVHHRIKNNMSTVMGLIELQIGSMKDPLAVRALEDTQNRIYSMMLLYQKLYEATDFTRVSLKDYFPPLIDEILTNFPLGHSVTVKKQIDDVVLDVDRVQPLGILLNELLTNAMKYAFDGVPKPSLTVSALLVGEQIDFSVEDNGRGLPLGAETADAGFGMPLVRSLAASLHAVLTVERGAGTRFRLVFPK